MPITPNSTPSATALRRPRRSGVHFAEGIERLLEGREAVLVAAARVAHHVAVGHRVVAELAAQRQIDDIGVEPEAPRPVDAHVELEGERDAIVQRIAHRRSQRVVHPGVQQEYPVIDVDVGRAHFERPVVRIGRGRRGCPEERQQAERGEEPPRDQIIPCWTAA
jgi:hypothetical protein